MKWKLENYNIDSVLVFSIIVKNKRPNLIVLNDRDKKAMLLELTVSLDENFEKAKQQKLKSYEELIE